MSDRLPAPTELAYEAARANLIVTSDELDEAFAEWEASDTAMDAADGRSDMEAYECAVALDAADRRYRAAEVAHARAQSQWLVAQADEIAAVAADVRAIRAHLEGRR
jgi:hypothetical protein